MTSAISRLIFALTYRCQCRCIHCSASLYEAKRAGELTTAEVRRVLDEAWLLGTREVNFFGGEALLRRDLFEVLEYARPRAEQVTVDSNGLLLTREAAQRLAAAGVDLVNLSLSGATADTHDRHHATPGAFDAVTHATEASLGAGLRVVYSTTVFRDILANGELEGVIALARGRGVHGVRLLKPMCSGEWLHRPDALLTDEETRRALALVDHDFVQFAEEEDGEFRRCHAVSSGTVYVGAYGEVQPCNFMPIHLGSVREEPLDVILDRATHAAWFQPEAQVGACPMERPEFAQALAAQLDARLALARLTPAVVRLPVSSCDLGCGFCDRGTGGPAEADLDRLEAEGGQVTIAGGEPADRPDFLQVIREARRRFGSVVCHTSARAFTQRRLARAAREAGLTEVVVPLFGYDAAAHDRVTGREGSFARALAGLHRLSSEGIVTRVVLYADESPGAFSSEVAVLVRLGAHRIYWQPSASGLPPPCGRGSARPAASTPPMRLVFVRDGPRGLDALHSPLLRSHLGVGKTVAGGEGRRTLRGPSGQRRALLLFPPIHTLERPLRTWTLHYATSCPSALLRFSSWLRSRGVRVSWLDALNVHDERFAEREIARILRPDNVVRTAPCGADGSEPQARAVYRMGLSRDELVARLRRVHPPPDEVFISSTFTWTWPTTHEAVALCRETFPGAWVALGGVYPTLCPDHARASGAHEVHTGVFAPVEERDVDIRVLAREGRDSVALKSSFGCPFRCGYCAVRLLEGRTYRIRDAGEIVREIESLARHGVRNIHFWESNLLVRPREHLEPILDGIVSRSLPVMLYAPEGLQPSLVTPGLARRMRQAGFMRVSLTVETTDPDRVREVRRPSGFSEFERAVRALREAGFSDEVLEGVLLVGQPGQTLASIATDLVALWGAGVKTVLLAYTPIPGTDDYRQYKHLWRDRPLEDLDSFLFPLASEDLRVADLECVLDRFNFRHASERQVRDWEPVSRAEARVRDHLLQAFASARG